MPVGVPAVFVGLMLEAKVGVWGIVLGLAILFLGIFNWIFEEG
jgi:hypothetical protein